MDVTAAVVAWAGFLATAATAGYTYLLARRARQTLDETRMQRVLAEGQANSARKSAEAACKQAHAAVDSARSSRESVELARQAQHRADQPRFNLTAEHHHDGVLHVKARMVAGPPEVQVSGTWKASSEGPPNSEGAHPFDHQEGSTTLHTVVLGDRIIVPVAVPAWADNATVHIELACAGTHGDDRKWRAPAVLEWKSKRSNVW